MVVNIYVNMACVFVMGNWFNEDLSNLVIEKKKKLKKFTGKLNNFFFFFLQ